MVVLQVGILNGRKIPKAFPKPVLSAAPLAAVARVSVDLHSRVRSGQALGKVDAVVAGTVVDDDDLQPDRIAVERQQTLDASFKGRSFVATRNDDRQRGFFVPSRRLVRYAKNAFV